MATRSPFIRRFLDQPHEANSSQCYRLPGFAIRFALPYDVASLFVFVTRFELMSNGKDQHRILGW
jgi:hypothetical protein